MERAVPHLGRHTRCLSRVVAAKARINGRGSYGSTEGHFAVLLEALAPDRSALMSVVCHTARIGLTSTIAADQPCRIIMAASATATLVRDIPTTNPPSSRNSSNQSTRLGGDQTEMRSA